MVATASADAGAIAMVVDAGVVVELVDAGSRVRADAGARVRDAALAVRVDAAVIAPIDATAMVASPPDAAVAVTGAIVIKNDAWCEVSIDGEGRGRASPRPLRVDAGTHTVICEQPGTGNKWTKTVEVAGGATVTVEGTMIGTLEVRLDVDATIDGTPHRRGATVRLKGGRHDLVIGGTKTFFDLRAACTVRSNPEPGCY